jgi:hypothetical protein
MDELAWVHGNSEHMLWTARGQSGLLANEILRAQQDYGEAIKKESEGAKHARRDLNLTFDLQGR